VSSCLISYPAGSDPMGISGFWTRRARRRADQSLNSIRDCEDREQHDERRQQSGQNVQDQ
jgi:hypothetical protein